MSGVDKGLVSVKPLAEAKGEIAYGASFLEWFAEEGKRIYGDTIPSYASDRRVVVVREPVGVVGAITPWNVPVLINLAKVMPSLAAGCTVVLKPAPDTPWSATHLGKIAAEKTDLPAGVLNIVPSSEHSVGEVLTTDPRVDLVTFTGSTATGRRVMECASATIKKVFLELGGKSASIILDDANLAGVLPMAAMTCGVATGPLM